MTGVYVQRLLPRWLTVILGVAGTVVAIGGIKAAAEVISPVVMALVLVVAVQPVLTSARRRGMPEWLAVTLTVVAVYAVIIGLALAVLYSIAQLGALLPQYANRWNGLLSGLQTSLSHLGVDLDQLRSALQPASPGSVLGFISGLIDQLLSVTTSLVFLVATVLFMCVDASSLPTRLAAVPGVSPALGGALAGFARNTRSYLLVTTVFGFVVAVVDAIALLIMGIPLPLVWGLLAFITNYIPNIGFFIGLAPPALLGLLVGGPELAAAVVAIYVLANFVIQSVIQPKFVGDAVGLSVTVTFVSLVAWAWILGPLGTILAIPMSLLVKAVLLDVDEDSRWARELVSSPPRRPRREREEPGNGPTESRDDEGVPVPEPGDLTEEEQDGLGGAPTAARGP